MPEFKSCSWALKLYIRIFLEASGYELLILEKDLWAESMENRNRKGIKITGPGSAA